MDDSHVFAIQNEALSLRDFCQEQADNPYNNSSKEKHVRLIFSDVAARASGIAVMLGRSMADSQKSPPSADQGDEVRSELTAILSVLDRIVKKVDLLYPDDLLATSVPEDENG